MSEALVKIDPTGADLIRTFDDLNRLGTMASKSGMFKDVKDAGQAVMKILAGRELGIGPMAALRGLHVFNGKVEASAGLIASKIKSHGKYDYRVTESTSERCEIEWFENGASIGRSSFTIQEAKNAGLAGKDVWKNYATDMLFARALTRGQRKYAPDVFEGSVYAPGEVSDEENRERVGAMPPNVVDAEQESLVGVSDETTALFERLLSVWTRIGKKAEDWPAYRQANLDGKSPDHLRDLLAKWEARAKEIAAAVAVTAPAAEPVDGAPTPDDLLGSIERERQKLLADLVTEDEIFERMMIVTDGEDLIGCTLEVLAAVLAVLEDWPETAAKAA